MFVPAPTQALALAVGIGLVLNGNMLVVALRAGPSTKTGTVETGAVEAARLVPRVAKKRMIEQVFRLPVEEGEPTASAFTHSQKGQATWFHAPRGTCAHKSISKGTVVTVTRPATGAVVTCKVADRGPFLEGRVIDLSRDTFVALAGADFGVIDVRLQW